MTAVDTSADVETIEHLDFVPNQLCEVIGADEKPCGAEAIWVCCCEMCPATTLMCEADRRELEEDFAAGIAISCDCGTLSSISHPRHRFEPIGRVR